MRSFYYWLQLVAELRALVWWLHSPSLYGFERHFALRTWILEIAGFSTCQPQRRRQGQFCVSLVLCSLDLSLSISARVDYVMIFANSFFDIFHGFQCYCSLQPLSMPKVGTCTHILYFFRSVHTQYTNSLSWPAQLPHIRNVETIERHWTIGSWEWRDEMLTRLLSGSQTITWKAQERREMFT